MKITVTFEPDPSVTISVVRDHPDFICSRLHNARVPEVMGDFRGAVDECVDRAMELGFIL